MAGKPATISDLFTPMKSIETCMERSGTEINTNLININDSVLSCAGNLSAGTKLLKSATKQIDKTITDSFKKLNEITEKQVSAGANAGAGIAAAVTGTIGAGFEGLGNMMMGTSQQIAQLITYVEKIEKNTNKKEGLVDKIKEKVQKNKAAKIEAPDVSGGKGVGDLAKALANAARVIDEISLPKAMLLKTKAKKVIGGILDVFKEYESELKPANMKKIETGAGHLKNISKSLLEIDKSMAAAAIFALPAVIGTKLTAKVINEAIVILEPLSDNKSTKKYETGAKNLENVGKSLLWFDAAMALGAILAIPAAIGVLGTGLIVKEALWIFKPLSEDKTTKSIADAAKNLEDIAKSTLWFNAAMALNAILVIPAAIGTVLSALVMRSAVALYKDIGKKDVTAKVKAAAISIEWMCLSTITFTLTMLATTMITRYILLGSDGKTDWTDLASIGGAISTFGLMVGAYYLFNELGNGQKSEQVRQGSYSVMLMSGAFILFSLSMLVAYTVSKIIVGDVMAGGKFDENDIAALAGTTALFGLMICSYFLYKKIGEPEDSKKVLAGGLSVLMMSLGFVAFALSLYVVHQISKSIVGNWDPKKDPWALIMDVAVMGLMLGSYYLYRKIGDPEDVKKVLGGGLAVMFMSIGFIVFGASLWLVDKMTKDMWKAQDGKTDWMSIVKTVAVLGLMYASMWVFKEIGNNGKSVLKGTGAVIAMAIGIAAFGFGIKFFVDSTKSADIGHLLMMPVLLGLFGIVFLGLGKAMTNVLLGSVVVLAMSVAVGAFGFGVKFYVDALQGADWKTVGMMAALIGIFGLEFALLGIPAVAGFVALGSAAMIVASGALFVIGKAVESFIEPIEKVSFKTVGKMAGIIGIFGLEFSALGLISPLITIGAGAALIMGGALKVLGDAVKIWCETDLDEKKLDLLCTSIDRIKLAFQGKPKGDDSGGGIGGFFKKLGGAISGALLAPFDLAIVGTTATALTMAGAAIKSLGEGLKAWNQTNIDEKKLDMLCTSIDRIKLAFQGPPKDADKGPLKRLLGSVSDAIASPFDVIKMQVTVAALGLAGKSIKFLTKGLKEWQDAGIDINSVDGLANVLVKIKTIFAEIGAKKNEGGTSLMKKIIGLDFGSFEMTDAERGANSVKKMGKALTSISKGLVEWKEGIGSKFTDNKFMGDFGQSVANVVASLTKVFSDIGKDKSEKQVKEAKTWFGKMWQDLTVNTFGPKTDNNVEKGIKAVKDLGKTIKDIAEGMKGFAEFKDSQMIIDVAAGISALLQGIQEPLIAFGTTDESFSMAASKMSGVSAQYGKALSGVNSISAQTMNFEHHKVDVANALKNVGHIGDMVKGLAEGAKTMADAKLTKDIGEIGTIEKDFSVTGGTGMVGNIQKLVCSQISVFTRLGEKIQKEGMHEVFEDQVIYDKINEKTGKKKGGRVERLKTGEKSYVAIAVESALGIGDVIKGIADGLSTMNESFPTDEKMTSGIIRISDAIISVMSWFSALGYSMQTGNANDVNGLPEKYKGKFSRIPGYVKNLTIMKDQYKNVGDSISSTISTFTDSFIKISENTKAVQTFEKNADVYMGSMINLTSMAYLLSDHVSGSKVGVLKNNKRMIHTLDAFNADIVESAEKNSKNMVDVVRNISRALPTLEKIKSNSGDSFVAFATQFTKGINILAGASTNINASTKFVTTLHNAVSSNVFGNISSNTKSIVESLNNLDMDVFEPYARMIESLGLMTKQHSDFVSMQKELLELLEKIIEKINEMNKENNTGSETTNVGSNSSKTGKNNDKTNNGQVQNQSVKAVLNTKTVTLEYKKFLDDFAKKCKELKLGGN